VQHTHLPERHTERVRSDLRHHRFQALPDCSRADIDRHRAIRLEVEPRRLLRTGAAALDKAGDSDAVVAPVDLAALHRTLFLPAELGEAAFEGFAIIAAVALGIDGRTARLQPWQPVRHLAGGRLEFRLSRRLSTASPWSASGLEACSPLGASAGVSCPTQGTEARVAQE
jgi:hypothetical protein